MEKKPGIWTDRQRMNWQGGGKNMLNIVLFEPEIPAYEEYDELLAAIRNAMK